MAQGTLVAVTGTDGTGSGNTYTVSITEDRTGAVRGEVGAISNFTVVNNTILTINVWWTLAANGQTFTVAAPPGTNVSHDLSPVLPAGTLSAWGTG